MIKPYFPKGENMNKNRISMLSFLYEKGINVKRSLREKFVFFITANHDDYLALKTDGYIEGDNDYLASITKKGARRLKEETKK